MRHPARRRTVRLMKALIVYESQFGNTEKVARAIAEGVATSGRVEVVAVDTAPTVLPDDVDLLLVGGPTHVFSMSRVQTRADAAKDAPTPTRRGIREWLAQPPSSSGRLRVATFGTKQGHGRLSGSAATAAAKAARAHGLLVDAVEDFFVTGRSGPLEEGELERATAWGRALGR